MARAQSDGAGQLRLAVGVEPDVGTGSAKRGRWKRTGVTSPSSAGTRGNEERMSSMAQVKVSVIYYSSTGTVHAMAQRLAEAAEKEGADVRLRQVRELAPEEAIASNAA